MTTSGAASTDRFAALFPGDSRSPRWWQHPRRMMSIILVVVALVVGAVATGAFGSSGPSYRVVSVSERDVDSALTGAATIEPVSQAKVAFPVSGKVAAVSVKVGDTVTPGQTLASLDTQSLLDTLHQKQAALAQAKLNLAKAIAGQSVGGLSGGTGASNGNAILRAARAGSSPRVVLTAATTPDPALAAAQQAVLNGQQHVDAAVATASTTLENATSACSAAGVGTTTTTTPTTTTAPPNNDLTACETALGDVLTAQKAVQAAQHTLADASRALDDLLARRAAQSTSPATGSSSSSGGSGGGGSGAALGSRTTGASSSPSSADLVAYQKIVDAAAVDVAVAQQAVDQATVASPIVGTVVAVNLEPGQSVTAASTTADVVVQGAGGYEVTTTVGVTKLADLALGQRATVQPDDSQTVLSGKVTSISAAPVSSSATTTNYRVVVALDNPNAHLDNGSTGLVSIITKNAAAVLAVPTSAVQTRGGRHLVTVLNGDSTSDVLVSVGVRGATWTQITSGLQQGEEVVIADLSQPLPGSATSSSNSQQSNGAGRFFFPGGANGQGRVAVAR